MASNAQPTPDIPKKKLKTLTVEPANVNGHQSEANDDIVKRKSVEKPPEPPLIPEEPQLRLYPCDVCNLGIRDDSTLITCRHCRLTVHPSCYGVPPEQTEKWMCDTCENDVRPECSTIYECLLCSQYENEDKSLMEPPKPTHKKKSEREKDKERLEREMIAQATEIYMKQQVEKGRPVEPRQALKATSQRNWSHVICSIMQPTISFGDAPRLRLAEGFGTTLQPAQKAKDARCKLCKDLRGALIFAESRLYAWLVAHLQIKEHYSESHGHWRSDWICGSQSFLSRTR